MSVQRRGVLRGETVVLGRARVISGQAQVLSDDGRVVVIWPPPRQGGRDASVEQAAPRQARLLVDARAELLVREVVDGLRSRDLTHQALPHELLERSHGLLVAPPARLPHGVEIEGPANDRRGAEHLSRHVAQSAESRVRRTPHLRAASPPPGP